MSTLLTLFRRKKRLPVTGTYLSSTTKSVTGGSTATVYSLTLSWDNPNEREIVRVDYILYKLRGYDTYGTLFVTTPGKYSVSGGGEALVNQMEIRIFYKGDKDGELTNLNVVNGY